MRVILKQDIKGVGRKYEVKNVADGYANNFLIPKKLAEYASADALKKMESLKLMAETEMEIREKLSEKQIEMLKGVKIVLKKKVSEKGHLFEKVRPEEISAALKDQAKIEIGPELLATENPIKEAGEHRVFAEVGKSRGEFQVLIEKE